MSEVLNHRPISKSHNMLYVEYGANALGRDFLVGDVHGEHDALIALLELVGFRFGYDRLFMAGDLVDRGPKPLSVLGLLRNDGVIAVKGNHDQWCVEAGFVGEPAGHRRYGGEWFYQLEQLEQQAVAFFLNQLPVALSFIGPCGNKFGVVHAEVPSSSWDWFCEGLRGDYGQTFCERYVTEALWRRTRYDEKQTHPVSGVEKVFVGHTVVDEVTELGNVVYLDTGGCFDDGRLTLVELQSAGGYVIHQL